MQCPGEKQEAQHAVHEGSIEIDLLQNSGNPVSDLKRRLDPLNSDQRKRSGKGDDHQSDRVRQSEEAIVCVAEQCGKSDKDRTNAE